MANINIYPIKSDLTYGDVVSKESAALIKALEEKTGHKFALVDDIEALGDGDLGLILVQSGGSEGKFKSLFGKAGGPFYLLTYGASNSLAASLEILSFIREEGKEGEILHGDPSYIAGRINAILQEKSQASDKRLPRLGVIGHPSDWLISSDVDYQRARKVLGVDLIDLTTQELIWDYASTSASVPEGRLEATFDKAELDKAYRLYKALKQMVKDHQLDALTLRCFDLLGSIKTTACLGLSLLNQKGEVAACEGDVPALLTSYTVYRKLGIHCFQANPCWVDAKNNEIIFAHCTLPLDMAESYVFDTHFESNIGVGIHGEMKKGPVTIVKLSASLKQFYCQEGELEENEYRKDRCRTQIKLKLNSPVNYFLTAPLGNHHLICYGNHKKELGDYYRSLGLDDISE
jgi:L-fucose isomerase-like protein